MLLVESKSEAVANYRRLLQLVYGYAISVLVIALVAGIWGIHLSAQGFNAGQVIATMEPFWLFLTLPFSALVTLPGAPGMVIFLVPVLLPVGLMLPKTKKIRSVFASISIVALLQVLAYAFIFHSVNLSSSWLYVPLLIAIYEGIYVSIVTGVFISATPNLRFKRP